MITTVFEQLERMENLYGDAIAFQYYDEALKGVRKITYKEYVSDVRRIGHFLQEHIPDIKGKHIAFLAKNSYTYVTYIMATIASNAVAVPLNIEKTEDEILYELANSDAEVLFHDGLYSKRNPAFLDKIEIKAMDMVACKVGAEISFQPDDPERMALIIYTSGTTEKSKGVMICQKGLYTSVNYVVVAFDQMKIAAPRYFFVLPLFHISGIMGVFSNGAIGATINLCPDMMFLYRDLELMPSDTTSVSPIVINSWYKDVKRGKKERLGGLKTIFVGGASLNSELISMFTENGMYISQGYGMTECGGIAGNTLTDFTKLDSIGTETVGCEVQFMDGEICVRSGSVMMGYYNNEEATKEAIIDGWLHTGDLGYKDADGYIYITGRKKNLIILDSGENVQPELLEKMLFEIPEVKEALVCEKNGKITACICAKEADFDTIREAVKEINKGLPLYSRMTAVELSQEELPKTSIGKVKRGKDE